MAIQNIVRFNWDIKKLVLIVFLSFLSLCSRAQRIDFMTPDFNKVDGWEQERSNFINGPDGYSALQDTSHMHGTDLISKRITGFYPEVFETVWNFWVLCTFDNNSVNNFQVFLIANGKNPDDENFKGIALGTGFKPKYSNVSLVYYDCGTTTVLYTDDTPLKKGAKTIFDVKRKTNGVWSVNGNDIFAEDSFKFWEADYLITSFSFSNVGASRFGFGFTDLYQSPDGDYHPSSVDSALILSSSAIRIFNNARLDASAAQNVGNYSLSGRHPQKIDYRFYYTDIYFEEGAISSGTALRLDVDNLTDIWGNAVEPFSQTFYQAGREDIVINEIMVDLNPAPFALPRNKYVELFNASARDLRLDGYTFCINGLEYEMPDIIFPGGGYLILCASDSAFVNYGPFANILQESKLTVSDKTLTVRNKVSALVDSVSYSDRLYNDPTRGGGGYSMERRDPRNSCAGAGNWHASTDLSGGTPGRINSQYQVYVDNTVPVLVGCKTLSPREFRMEFSEPVMEARVLLNGEEPDSWQLADNSITVSFAKPMRGGGNIIVAQATDICRTAGPGDTVSIEYRPFDVESIFAVSAYQLIITFSCGLSEVSTGNFQLSDGQIPILCEFTSDGRRHLMLTFADDFASEKKYRLSVRNLCNSIGEIIDGRDFGFRYHAPVGGDLLINEVMYYPNVGEKRYVEIYNNSGSDVFLYGITLRHHSAGLDVCKSAMSQSHSILPDGGYAVLAADTASVCSVYGADSGKMAYCPGMPALNTGKGYVVLLSADGNILDSMYYEKSMHSAILQSVRGVALERVSPLEDSMEPGNWQSAQANSRFATPGRRNSVSESAGGQEIPDGESAGRGEEVYMENQLIRPGDMDRALRLVLDIPRQNVCVSASVYDEGGRPRRSLVTQEMVYPGCEILWDARDDHGSFCSMGMYIVLIKAWDPTGWTKNYKMVCVVGSGR